MKEARIQLRIDRRLKEQAERIAKRQHTTLSAVVTRFLKQLVDADVLSQRAGAQGAGDVEQV